MNAPHTRGEDFLNWLQLQVKNRDDKRLGGAARKALADMRRAARDSLNGNYDIGRVAPHIGEYLSDSITPDDEWLSVVGALYALSYANVPQTNEVSLGKALRRLRNTDKGNDSLEARFMALLNSREENLPGHLRQAIALLDAAQKGIGLDWKLLWQDMQWWSRAERKIQKQWLRDFYRADKRETAPVVNDNTTPEIEGDNDDED